MAKRYWAVRPKSPDLHRVATRIEHAETALEAYQLAFGRGSPWGNYEAKDLGGQARVIQSDRRRIELLTSPDNWVTLGRPIATDERSRPGKKRPFAVRLRRVVEQFADVEVWAENQEEAQASAERFANEYDWPDADLAEDDVEVESVRPKEAT